MNATTPELTQCGQCKGWFPMASSTPDAADGLFSHNCSSEPKQTRQLTETPKWANTNVDAPEQTGNGGTGRPVITATNKQVAFILKLQGEKLAVDAMGRKDEDGRSVAQVLDIAFGGAAGREAHVRKMAKAKASKYIDELMAAPNVAAAADPKPVAATGTAMTELEAADFVRLLGRKLEVSDVTPELHSFAATWAANWTGGDFQFMVDMRDAARSGKFSVGQAKGVLNCFRADVLRATKPAATPKVADETLERGQLHTLDGRFYRVVMGQNSGNLYANEWLTDGSTRTITTKEGTTKTVGNGRWEFAQGAIAKLSADTLATPEQAVEFGIAYANCGYCGHDLDTDRSTTVGYGPKCAAKRGLPW